MFKKYPLTILGILLGVIFGYLYYHFVGCPSGTCNITSYTTTKIELIYVSEGYGGTDYLTFEKKIKKILSF